MYDLQLLHRCWPAPESTCCHHSTEYIRADVFRDPPESLDAGQCLNRWRNPSDGAQFVRFYCN